MVSADICELLCGDWIEGEARKTVLAPPLRQALEKLVAPFEARPILRSQTDIEKRRQDLGFGWELARLQGAEKAAGWVRLLDLYANGQITQLEYRQLGLKLAMRGELHVSPIVVGADRGWSLLLFGHANNSTQVIHNGSGVDGFYCSNVGNYRG